MRSMVFAVSLISVATHSAHPDDKIDRSPKDRPTPLTAPFNAGQAKAAQEAWAKFLGKSSPAERNSIEMELVLIPPGRFTMGSPPGEKDRATVEDQVEVTLTKAFYMGKTEVTQGQWQAVMGTTPWKGKKFVPNGDNNPATWVNWEEARAFCKRLGEKELAVYRLPTEAEWEYACRAGTTTQFSFGDDESKLEESAWYQENARKIGEKFAHEVGRKRANPFGLHDMHGNLWEWCEDVYVDKLPGGTDPLASAGGSYRVRRGGAWSFEAAYCRSASRPKYFPSPRNSSLGFRVARSSDQ